jgi:hypothetical protein
MEKGGLDRKGNVHKGVRKAHFAAVDDAISYTFDECEDVVVFGVKDDFLEGSLWFVRVNGDFGLCIGCVYIPRGRVISP